MIVALGYLVNALFQPVAGHYSEKRDSARILTAGISLIAIAIVSFVFATGFPPLLASVILLRLGSRFFHSVGIWLPRFSEPACWWSLGILSSGHTIGTSVLGLLSGHILQFFGLEVSFGTVAILTLLGSVLTLAWFRVKVEKSL